MNSIIKFTQDQMMDMEWLLSALRKSLSKDNVKLFGKILFRDCSEWVRNQPVECYFTRQLIKFIIVTFNNKEALEVFIKYLESELALENESAKLDKQMIVAVCRNDLKRAEDLLNSGVKIETINDRRDFSIECIVSVLLLPKNVEMMKLLIKYGLDIRTSDSNGENLYHFLAGKVTRLGVAEIARVLYDLGLTAVDEPRNYRHDTPLNIAIENLNFEMAEFLIRKGANANGITNFDVKNYDLPLIKALKVEDEDLIDLLLENGANVNARVSGSSHTILHELCNYISAREIKLLLEKGADINVEDSDGITPVFYLDTDDLFYDDNEYADCLTVMVKALSRSAVVSKRNMEFLRTDTAAREIFDKCSEELNRMRNTVFYPPFSYHSVLMMSTNLRKLSKLTKNEEFVKAFLVEVSSFDYFSKDLKSVFDNAAKLRDDFLTIRSNLKSIFKETLPDLVLDNIAKNLTVKDIKFV